MELYHTAISTTTHSYIRRYRLSVVNLFFLFSRIRTLSCLRHKVFAIARGALTGITPSLGKRQDILNLRLSFPRHNNNYNLVRIPIPAIIVRCTAPGSLCSRRASTISSLRCPSCPCSLSPTLSASSMEKKLEHRRELGKGIWGSVNSWPTNTNVPAESRTRMLWLVCGICLSGWYFTVLYFSDTCTCLFPTGLIWLDSRPQRRDWALTASDVINWNLALCSECSNSTRSKKVGNLNSREQERAKQKRGNCS